MSTTVAGVTAAVLSLLQPCDSGPWPTKYDRIIDRAVAKYWPHEYWPLRCRWKAQLIAESGLDPTAVSPVGALSVSQTMPATFAEVAQKIGLTCHPQDAKCSILAGTWYMRTRLDYFTWDRTLLERAKWGAGAYNAGALNLDKAQRLCDGTTSWSKMIKCLPQVTGAHARETIGYVARIGRIVAKLRA